MNNSPKHPLQTQVSQRRLSAQQIATALGAKPAGENKWKARCPAHEDKNPSFSIAETPNGKVLVKCWAGCTQEQVIRALQDRRLWPDFDELGTPRESRPQINPRLEELLNRVYWFLIIEQRWESDLRELDSLLSDAEFIQPGSSYIVVGQILEDAARISYHCLARVSAVLLTKGSAVEQCVGRWMNERYPTALFEPRT